MSERLIGLVLTSDLGVPADLLVHGMQGRQLEVQDVDGHLSDVGLVQVPAHPLHLLQQPGLLQHTHTHTHTGHSQSAKLTTLLTPSMHLVFASALLPDVQSDPMSLLLGADQVHVVGDEELAGAGYRGAPGWHEHGGAEVRGPIVMYQLAENKQNKPDVYFL